MRKVLFPVSWVIQSRLAEVATVVDENTNGVRVVKSFAAEEQQLRQMATAAEKVQWAYIKDADLRARFSPLIQNLSQVGLVFVLVLGGYMVIHGHLQLGAILQFNIYLLMMQAPFMMLGMLIMMGQRAAASADRIYEILDEQATIVDRAEPTAASPCRWRTVETPTCWPTSTFTYARVRRWPWWDGPEAANRRWPGCSPGSMTSPTGPC